MEGITPEKHEIFTEHFPSSKLVSLKKAQEQQEPNRPQKQHGAPRVLHFYFINKWCKAFVICESEGPERAPLYYTDISRIREKPDVAIRQGNKEGPVLAAGHFRCGITQHLCVGEPTNVATLWENMRRKNRASPKTHLLNLTQANGVQHLQWKRAIAPVDEKTGKKRHNTITHTLTNLDTKETIAVYHTRIFGRAKKLGELVFLMQPEKELELWTVVSCAGIIEKARR